jgi:glycosyltransferase involved in cell wall biosynthesis
MNKTLALALYADFGSLYGKGPRLTKLNSIFLRNNINPIIYCRQNKNSSTKLILTPTSQVKTKIASKTILAKIFKKSKNFNRNSQENTFDLWLSKNIKEDITFMAPGFWRTAEVLSKNDSQRAFIHSVVCHPQWVRKKLQFIEHSSRVLNLPYFVSHIFDESKRVEKVIETKPKLFFPSSSVAQTYKKFLDTDYFENNTVTQFSWAESFERNQISIPKIKKYGFVGTLSALKGVHILVNLFLNKLKNKHLNLYGPLDGIVSKDILCSARNSTNISYNGVKSINDIAKDVDVLIVPSILDAEPRVIREFLALDKLVISSNDITSISHDRLFKFTSSDNVKSFLNELEETIEHVDGIEYIACDPIIHKAKKQKKQNFEEDLATLIAEYL